MVELIIGHGDKIYLPATEDGITWTTDRKGSPGSLKFNVLKDAVIDFQEGDPVRLKVNDKNVFYGFVFQKKRQKDKIIKVTAYDQLRYLKNKDTYVFENKTASQIITMLANDFSMNTGDISATKYMIPSLVESNSTLFDIIQSALDLELQNRGEMYVLYDDFGKLTLKNIADMKLDLLISEETAEDFDYESSIENSYNQVKLIMEDSNSGSRDVWINKDSSNINQWGVLQYTDTVKNGEDGAAKAAMLLDLYNQKTRTLKITNAFGDVRCRAGSLVITALNLGDIILQNYMMVEKATHTFKNNEHFMSLNLRGGLING